MSLDSVVEGFLSMFIEMAVVFLGRVFVWFGYQDIIA